MTTRTLPADDFEFKQCWSNKGGEAAAIDRARCEVDKRAGEAFVKGQDNVANALRDLAATLRIWHERAASELQDYVDEERRRSFEKTKMLRH